MRTDPYAPTSFAEIVARREEEQSANLDLRGDDSWASRRRAGLVAPKPPRKPHQHNAALKERSAERTGRALEMHRAGLTRAQIAKHIGVTPPVVSRMLNRVGVRLRTAPRQSQVVDAIAAGARTVPEISRRIQADPKNVATALITLHEKGRIRRVRRGVYVLPVDGVAA